MRESRSNENSAGFYRSLQHGKETLGKLRVSNTDENGPRFTSHSDAFPRCHDSRARLDPECVDAERVEPAVLCNPRSFSSLELTASFSSSTRNGFARYGKLFVSRNASVREAK